jgi:hypothetical protein
MHSHLPDCHACLLGSWLVTLMAADLDIKILLRLWDGASSSI